MNSETLLIYRLTRRTRLQHPLFISLLLAVSLLILMATVAWAAGELLWQDQFDIAGNNESGNAVIAHGRQVFTAGRAPSAAGNWMVRAHDSETGALMWQTPFFMNNFFDMDVYGDQIYVVGHISGNVPGGFDGILKAYDTQTGTLLWQEQYDLNEGFDVNYGVTARAGLVYVCGESTGASGYQDWIVRALDARDGSLVWQDQFDLADFPDHAWTAAVDGHRLFVAGYAMTATGGFDYSAMVRAYHAGNGALLWQYQFDVPGSEDEAYFLAVGGNSVFVGGRVENIPPYDADWLLLALNAEDGVLLWQEQFGLVGGHDSLTDIAFIRNQLIAAGRATNSSGDRVELIRAYDARNGAFLWQNQIELDGNPVTISGIEAEKHQVFVAGYGTNAAGNRDWGVQALHVRDGELLWQDQFDLAGGSDRAAGIDVARGRIFVNGSGTNADGNSDWILRAYQAR